MKKRNLFEEIQEGFEALAEVRAGKLTLRTHRVEMSETSRPSGAANLTTRRRPGRSDARWLGPTQRS